MHESRRSFVTFGMNKAVIGLLLCFVWTASGAGEKQETAAMEALLQEVRELRLVVERSSVAVPRLQAALAKFHMQQMRVDQISDRLQQLRSVPVEDVKELEGAVFQQVSGSARREAEARAQAARNRVAYEQQVARQLQVEQSLLRTYEHDLRRAEAALEAPKR